MVRDGSSSSQPSEGESRAAALAIAPGVLLAGVAGGIAFPILPIIGMREGLSLVFIGAILAANRATRVLSSPLVGAASDRFGGRRTLLAGLVLQMAVMLLYTLGVTWGHPGPCFLAGRMLHGPASAGVFVAGQALALHAGGRVHGGRSAATVRAAMALGVPVGLVAGGVLSDRFGNAVTFELAFAGVVLASVVAWWIVPDLRVPVPKGAGRGEILRELRDRRLLALGAINFAASFSAQGMVLTTISLVVHARGVSMLGFGDKGTSGLLMGIMVVVSALVMPVAGRIGDRYRVHPSILLGALAALGPSLAVVALAPTPAGLVTGLSLLGLSAGALSPSMLALLGDVVPQERRGMGVGALQLCGDLGGTLGPLVGTALFAQSFRAAYLASAVLVACFVPLGILLARWARERTRVTAR